MGVFSKFVCFTIGLYAGAYYDQNYEVPKLPDPASIPKKIEEFLERYKKE